MELKEIIELVSAGVSVLIAILTIVVAVLKNCKSEKAKKIAQGALEIAKKVDEFVIKAEDIVGFENKGSAKKEWVTTKVEEYCIDNGLNIHDYDISNEIEQAVYLASLVNSPAEKRAKAIELREKEEATKLAKEEKAEEVKE